ncbi:MAG TPA: DUF6763 family protein [Gammaproteobacteria bacterium]
MNDAEHVFPFIGSWYKDAAGAVFEVVALDDDDHSVGIQYFDGTVEELDLDMWWDTPMEMVEPPEDWSGSLDIDREDYGVDLGEIPVEEWGTALDFIERAK